MYITVLLKLNLFLIIIPFNCDIVKFFDFFVQYNTTKFANLIQITLSYIVYIYTNVG